MNKPIGLLIATYKSNYEQFVKILPESRFTNLDAIKLKKGQISILSDLSSGLSYLSWEIDRYIDSLKGNEYELVLPDNLAIFYNDVYKNKAIQEFARHFCSNVLFGFTPINLGRFCDDIKLIPITTPVRNFIAEAVDIVNEKFTRGDYDEGVFDEDQVDGAMSIVNLPLFQPDEWIDNKSELHPIITPCPDMPERIRIRINEIMKTCFFGCWLSVCVNCRALLEFSLFDCAKDFGVTTKDSQGKLLQLFEIENQFAVKKPAWKNDLEKIRVTGNNILHPKQDPNVENLSWLSRQGALDVMSATISIVSKLYTHRVAIRKK